MMVESLNNQVDPISCVRPRRGHRPPDVCALNTVRGRRKERKDDTAIQENTGQVGISTFEAQYVKAVRRTVSDATPPGLISHERKEYDESRKEIKFVLTGRVVQLYVR
jgi:hypothetical protein